MFSSCKSSRALNMIGIDRFLRVTSIRFKCLITIIISVEHIKWALNLSSFVIIFSDFWDIYSLSRDVYAATLDGFYYKKKHMYTCERCTFKIDEIDIFTDTLSFFTREYSPKREDRGGRFKGEFFGFFFVIHVLN